MNFTKEQVVYEEVAAPQADYTERPVNLTDETMEEHRQKILSHMRQSGTDVVVVYADREHGANFEYLTGFVPRFEEALLVLHKDGRAYMILGNEMLNMAEHSRIPVTAIHAPYFSLPNQPMGNEKSFVELIGSAEIKEGMSIGLAGWKMFTSTHEDNDILFDIPHYIVEAIRQCVGKYSLLRNVCDFFLHPAYGARTTVNANEIAHYEFGAALASDGMLAMMGQIEPGKTELELASCLNAFGQPGSVQTICASGERFTNAVVAPRNHKLAVGEKFSATVGYVGGLTNRAGYLVENESELPDDVKDYLGKVVKPYYAAVASWYSTVGIGVTGGELYDTVETVIPKEHYGWSLNPGHLIGFEEWMSSPIESGSQTPLRSGMMLQMDIIIKVPGYGGTNAEDGIVLADEALRDELRRQYPEVWSRIQRRVDFMKNELNIPLKPEVLPLSNTSGYLRPYLLNRGMALRIRQGGLQ